MDQYAVVTGASSGIGAAFARRLAKDGYRLILTARRGDRLRELAREIGGNCEVVEADLSHEEDCYRLYEKIGDRKISLFINNAGFGDCSFFPDGDIEKELDMIRVNVVAVHLLTKLILRKFQKQGEGALLNVASIAGLLPAGPYMAAYYATKAYVRSLTAAVARELDERDGRIYVGCLCPGPVDTEFNSRANVEFALPGISADACASYALRRMKKRKTVIVPGFYVRLAMRFRWAVPEKWLIRMVGRQQKKKIAPAAGREGARTEKREEGDRKK